MKFVKWLLILVACLLGLFLVITAFLPKTYSVHRTVAIDASPELIFSQIADLKAWQEWNPWNDVDPAIKVNYGEKTSGEGASYSWESQVAGNGEMTIVNVEPASQVQFELRFEGYEDLPSYSSIILDNPGGTSPTQVIWTFRGSVGDRFFARWMTVIMDKVIGSSYEKGLQSLKERCERLAEVTSPAEARVGG